jgi:hypothetical protein
MGMGQGIIRREENQMRHNSGEFFHFNARPDHPIAADSAGEQLRKKIHHISREALAHSKTESTLIAVSEMEQALEEIIQLLQQRPKDLSLLESNRLLSMVMKGIAERTQAVKVRFIDNN